MRVLLPQDPEKGPGTEYQAHHADPPTSSALAKAGLTCRPVVDSRQARPVYHSLVYLHLFGSACYGLTRYQFIPLSFTIYQSALHHTPFKVIQHGPILDLILSSCISQVSFTVDCRRSHLSPIGPINAWASHSTVILQPQSTLFSNAHGSAGSGSGKKFN